MADFPTEGPDLIFGTGGDDVIDALGGDDEVRAQLTEERQLVESLRQAGRGTEAERLSTDYHGRQMAGLAADVYASARGDGQPPTGWIRGSERPELLAERLPGMNPQQIQDLLHPAGSGYRAEIYLPETNFGFEYSPEIFMDTELDFSLEICEAVMDAWQPDADREIVLNLPCTVERSTPNVYADQIEYMSRNLTRREFVCLSVHTHNDRGTATADAELAMLADAQRMAGIANGRITRDK